MKRKQRNPGEGTVDAPANSRGRLVFIKILFLLLFVVVALRLVQIQVLESAGYKEAARRQYEDKMVLQAARGTIYDRAGRPLVSHTRDISVAADPRMLGKNKERVASRLASALGGTRQDYARKLNTGGTNFVWLKRHVSPDLLPKIRPGDFPGLIVAEETRRVYHYNDLAGQLLGFTDPDSRGISGIELEFDNVLRGINGYEIRRRDGLGRAMAAVDYPRVDPVNGRDVRLTIDLDYQAIAEEALKAGIDESKAESGLVVMLDPRTFEILAMVNYPRLNPARAAGADQSLMRNRGVTDMFEPGSVFKVVTAAAALEHGLVKPQDKFFAENGQYRVPLPGGRSRTISDTHPHGVITFQEAMEVSSNIVLAKISDKIGAERLYRSARDFGFGTETGVELPGEIGGDLKKPTEWSGTTLNTMAYGYEVAVTPLQIAAAYGVVANGGTLYKPTILKGTTGEEGPDRPQVIRRVISEQTAATLTGFLSGVVEKGTGVGANVGDVAVAGKTGTARKVVDGKYDQGSYTATFAGFFPAVDPKVVCVVMLDTRSKLYSGGQTSAPIFRNIAERVLALSERFAGTATADARLPGMLTLPDVRDMEVEAASGLLGAAGFEVETRSEGILVTGQSPRPGTSLPAGGRVILEAAEPAERPPHGNVRVPDLRNLSIRRAMNRLALQHLTLSVRGSGRVVSQSPAAGQLVKPGTAIVVRCQSRSELALRID
jgi:cell division protein FtsI/penicillin-binding protein 2